MSVKWFTIRLGKYNKRVKQYTALDKETKSFTNYTAVISIKFKDSYVHCMIRNGKKFDPLLDLNGTKNSETFKVKTLQKFFA